MYQETRGTIFTIILTALIVGGGMYAYFNFTAENINITELDDAKTEEQEEVTKTTEEKNIQIANDNEKEENLIWFENENYSFLYPSSWRAIAEGEDKNQRWDITTFRNSEGGKIATLRCPMPETGFETWVAAETNERNNANSKFRLFLGTPVEGSEDLGPLGIIMMEHGDDWSNSCMLSSEGLNNNSQEWLFNLFKDIFDSLKITTTEDSIVTLNTEKVFEPKTFTNKVYHYTIDHPKNWYWNDYGYQNDIMRDIVGFSKDPLSEYIGSYPGKVVVQIMNRSLAEIIAESQGLENMTQETIKFNGINATKIRGELPEDGMSVGDTRLVINVFFEKNDLTYIINTMGATDDDEKLFYQMVESFKFLN